MATQLALPRRSMPTPPAHIAARIAARQQAGIAVPVLGTGRATGINRISLKGMRFRQVIDGEIVATSQSTSLDVVIVGVENAISRQYYDKPYNADEPAAPACWSRNGKTPDASAPSPQGTACALCPMNAKGSAIAGNGKAKACSSRQRIAVMVMGDDTGTVYALDAKGMTLFGKDYKKDGYLNLNNYGATLSKQGVTPWEMVTTLTFDPSADVPKLLFSVGDFLDEDELVAVMDKAESEEVKAMLNAVDSVDDEGDSAPAGLAPRAPVAKAAARPAPQAPAQQAPVARQAPAQQAPAARQVVQPQAQQAPVQQAPAAQQEAQAPAPRTRVGRAQAERDRGQSTLPSAQVDALEAATQQAVQAVASRPRLGGGAQAQQAQQAPAGRARLGGGVRTIAQPSTMDEIDEDLEGSLGAMASG